MGIVDVVIMWNGLPWTGSLYPGAKAAYKVKSQCVLQIHQLCVGAIRATRCHSCSMMLALPCRAALPAWATLLHRTGITALTLQLPATMYIGLPPQAGLRTSQPLRYRACAEADSEVSDQRDRPWHLSCVPVV